MFSAGISLAPHHTCTNTHLPSNNEGWQTQSLQRLWIVLQQKINSDHVWEILCNILLVILFSCAHGARFLLWAWLVMQPMTQTLSDRYSRSLSGTKHPACAWKSWYDVHCLSHYIKWMNWSSDPLQREWKCQFLRGTEELNLWTEHRDFFFFPSGKISLLFFFPFVKWKT